MAHLPTPPALDPLCWARTRRMRCLAIAAVGDGLAPARRLLATTSTFATVTLLFHLSDALALDFVLCLGGAAMRSADVPRAGKGEVAEFLFQDHLFLHDLVVQTKDEAIPECPLPEPGVSVDILPAGVAPQPPLAVAALMQPYDRSCSACPSRTRTSRTRFVGGHSICRPTPRRADSAHGNSGDRGGGFSGP